MTREDIIRMAREAGIDAEKDTLCRYEGWVEPLERFAALVAAAERKRLEATAWGASKKWIVEAVAAEREACAKVCEGLTGRSYEFDMGRLHSAASIRARGKE